MAKIIEVRTQAELDALPDSFAEFTEIRIFGGTVQNRIVVRKAYGNSSVEARDNSSVIALNNSSVVARDNSNLVARHNSSVVAWENSSIEAFDNSSLVAWENSSVVSLGYSNIVARHNSSVVARNNSSVVAIGNSRVLAFDNSSIEALNNSSIEAFNNSSVVAFDNSSVSAYDCSFVKVLSNRLTVKKLFDYSTAVFRGVPELFGEKHETATVKVVTDKMLYRSFDEELSRGYVKADGIFKKFISKKKIGEIEVFEVSDFPRNTTSFVVKKADTFSHGGTIEKAIEDLRFKISDRDTSKFEHWKNQNAVVSLDEAITGYRTITGACELGTKQFINSQGILPDSLSVKEIIERTMGSYGNDILVNFVRGEK